MMLVQLKGARFLHIPKTTVKSQSQKSSIIDVLQGPKYASTYLEPS